MKKPLTRAALVTTALAAVLLPAAAASAATLTISDATDDVWATDMSATTETFTAAGSPVNLDIVKTAVRYDRGKVTVKTTYVDLKKADYRFMLGIRLRTNEGLKREVDIETFSRTTWGGSHHLSKPNGSEVACRGLAHEIDYAANTIKAVVPASCLSKPRWVQASVAAFGVADGQDDTRFYLDNGHSKSSKQPGWSAKIRRG